MRLWSIALVAALVLAGCANGSSDDPDSQETAPEEQEDWAARAVPWELHDHYDPAQHQNLSSPNFELLGWDPLVSDHYGATAGGHLCGDATDAGPKRLAVVHGISTDVAFVLIDVTDPAAPEPLGEFVLPRSSSRDVAITPDGKSVIVGLSTPDAQDNNMATPEGDGSQDAAASVGPAADTSTDASTGASSSASNDASSDTPPGTSTGPPRVSDAIWRTPCGDFPVKGPEQDLPLPPGAMLVDVSDPTAPEIVDIYPMPVLGAHSVYAGDVPGRTIVIVSVVNLVQTATNFHFFEVQDTVQGSRMVPLGVYTENPTTGGAPLINGHNDGVVQRHPITGQDLAYLANWDQGMNIVDIGSPVLTPVGHWSDDPGPSSDLQRDGVGSVHEAIPIEGLWDDRHYTVIGQEIIDHPSATPSGWVKILDTTDPSAPVEVAEWTLPVDVFWDQSLVFSSHYVTLHNKTLYVAHYHAGVWAIDLSCIPDCKHPPAVGVFVPANVSPSPPPDSLPYDWTPTVMEAVALDNGDVVIYDARSGVYVTRFDADDPMPPRVWTGYSDDAEAQALLQAVGGP